MVAERITLGGGDESVGQDTGGQVGWTPSQDEPVVHTREPEPTREYPALQAKVVVSPVTPEPEGEAVPSVGGGRTGGTQGLGVQIAVEEPDQVVDSRQVREADPTRE